MLNSAYYHRLGSATTGCFKESFNITGGSVASTSLQWPDDIVPGFSESSKNFMRQCKRLSMRILDALSHGMKLKVSVYIHC